LTTERQSPEAGSPQAGAESFLTLAAQVFACVVGVVVLLLPRRPTSAAGWLAYLLVITLLVAVFFGLARILLFLERRPRQRLANRLLGVVVAVVPGAALVYVLFSHADLVMRYFQ
jgi:prolipoprotein diacylglyceryltransferase